MKFFRRQAVLLGPLAILATMPLARAQNNDAFDVPLSVQLCAPQLAPLVTTLINNQSVDMRGFLGRGSIDACYVTNGANASGAGTVAITVQTAPDATNWSNLSGYAVIASSTVITITNFLYAAGGTNGIITPDVFWLPYTPNVPPPWLAGYNTPNPLWLPWTNAAASLTLATNGVSIGVNLQDQQRYLRTIWTLSNSATNGNTAIWATLTGNRAYLPMPGY